MKEFQILQSTRGVLYYLEEDGYFFYKQKVRNSKMYLKCHFDSCPVRAVTHASLKRSVKFSLLAHNHAPNPEWPEVQKLRIKILNRCKNEATHPKTIYDEEISKVRNNVAIQLPFNLINRTMYRRHKDFMDLTDYIQANESDDSDNVSNDEHGLNYNIAAEDLVEVIDCERDENTSNIHDQPIPRKLNKYPQNETHCKRLCYEELLIKKILPNKESETCVICKIQPPTIVCIPCGHICLCDICKHRYNEDICPACHIPLSPFIKIS